MIVYYEVRWTHSVRVQQAEQVDQRPAFQQSHHQLALVVQQSCLWWERVVFYIVYSISGLGLDVVVVGFASALLTSGTHSSTRFSLCGGQSSSVSQPSSLNRSLRVAPCRASLFRGTVECVAIVALVQCSRSWSGAAAIGIRGIAARLTVVAFHNLRHLSFPLPRRQHTILNHKNYCQA